MNAPREPWDQGGPGQPPDQPGPRYYPPPPGQAPGQGVPYGGGPPSGQPLGPGDATRSFAYNPYGAAPPGHAEPAAVTPAPRRPGIMVLALIMQILVSVPFLFVGIAVLLVPLNTAALPPEILDSPQLQRAGATPELLVSLVRTTGVIVLVVALIYLLFAVLAFAGRNWARIIAGLLSVAFVLLLVAGLVTGGGAADTLIILGILVVLLLGSVVISFLPASNAWYTHRR